MSKLIPDTFNSILADLLYNLTFIFATTSVITPLYYAFEPFWFYRLYKRH